MSTVLTYFALAKILHSKHVAVANVSVISLCNLPMNDSYLRNDQHSLCSGTSTVFCKPVETGLALCVSSGDLHHTYIIFQVLPAGLFRNLFTTNTRFGG